MGGHTDGLVMGYDMMRCGMRRPFGWAGDDGVGNRSVFLLGHRVDGEGV